MKQYLFLLLSLLLFCACDDEKPKFEPDGLTAFCKCYTENVYVVEDGVKLRVADANKYIPGAETELKYICYKKGSRIHMNPETDFIKNDTIYMNDTISSRNSRAGLPLRLAVPAKYFDFHNRVEWRDFDHFGYVFYHHVSELCSYAGFDVLDFFFNAENVGNEKARSYMWISFGLLALCFCIWLYVLFSASCPELLFWGWVAIYCACGYYQFMYFIGYNGSLFSDTFCETLFCTPYLLYVLVHIVMITSLLGNFNNRYASERSVHFSIGIAGLFVYVLLIAASTLFNDFFGWGAVNVAFGLGCWLALDALYAAYKNRSFILPFLSVLLALLLTITISSFLWIAISCFWAFISFAFLGSILYSLLGGYTRPMVYTNCGECRQWSSLYGDDRGYCASKRKPRNRYTTMCHSVREHVIENARSRDAANYLDHKRNPRAGDRLASSAGGFIGFVIDAIYRVQSTF